MKSSFNGYIKEIPFISVDNFEDSNKNAYFLSHFHGDHIFGLKSRDLPNKLKENKSFIYGSAVTIAIVRNEVRALSPFLKVLDLGRNTVAITTNAEEIYLNVIVLPAGHSLGSVMYLFYYKETVLFTGDFRITPNTVHTYTHLHENGEPVQIDVMYVDTTFQHVASFPRRSDVVRNVVDLARDWLNRDLKNTVEFVTSAQYGYECVCNEIYNATGLKTYINENKWPVFSQFPKEIYGITNDATARIALTSKYECRFFSTGPEVLTIFFSAMKWGVNIEEESFLKEENNNTISVCFATHCGRDELLYFINYLKPKIIIGFPMPFKVAAVTPPVECQLNFDISERLKPNKVDSDNKNVGVGKKISKEKIQSLFDW